MSPQAREEIQIATELASMPVVMKNNRYNGMDFLEVDFYLKGELQRQNTTIDIYAQALVDLGVEQDVHLIGGSAYGWAVDEQGVRHEFGDESYYTGLKPFPANTSYIVWRRR